MASEQPASIFEAEWWPAPVATAWVLSRDRRFTEACTNIHGDTKEWLDDMQAQAEIWRLLPEPLSDPTDYTYPIMLFPSSEDAWFALCRETTWGVAGIQGRIRVKSGNLSPWSQELSPTDVLVRFPRLEDSDRALVMSSVWSGNNPREHNRIPLSHAAWWIGSKGGISPFALDNSTVWDQAFEALIDHVLQRRISIFADHPPPARRLPSEPFADIPFEYPLARSRYDRSPHKDQPHIACSLQDLDPGTDRYFVEGNIEPKWRRLSIPSSELIKQLPTTSGKTFASSMSLTEQRDREIASRLKTGARPGQNVAWKEFANDIRDKCQIARDRHARGFDQKTIERIVRKTLGN
jgi:hypothetical protein